MTCSVFCLFNYVQLWHLCGWTITNQWLHTQKHTKNTPSHGSYRPAFVSYSQTSTNHPKLVITKVERCIITQVSVLPECIPHVIPMMGMNRQYNLLHHFSNRASKEFYFHKWQIYIQGVTAQCFVVLATSYNHKYKPLSLPRALLKPATKVLPWIRWSATVRYSSIVLVVLQSRDLIPRYWILYAYIVHGSRPQFARMRKSVKYRVTKSDLRLKCKVQPRKPHPLCEGCGL